MALTTTVGKSIDAGAVALLMAGFERLKSSDGMSLRRYVRITDRSQSEIALYRDKWWTKSGGTIRAEAWCLVNEFQLALSGIAQDWTRPDYAIPLHHFQYSLRVENTPFVQQVESAADGERLRSALETWLQTHALPWVLSFDEADAVHRHLEAAGRFAPLAMYQCAHGELAEARRSVARFLATYPRNIDTQLADFVERDLLSREEGNLLRAASLQSNPDYERAVATWLSSTSSTVQQGR